jgi:hypothetical protein
MSLGYKNPVRTSQETHYVSAKESSQLMLCKIWGFHRSNYEECRLLGYKNPIRTSQETHYVSGTEPRQLMLCKFWDIQGDDYEEFRLVGCYALWHVVLLLVTANFVPISPSFVALMMDAIRSTKTSVLTRATRRYIPEDGILHVICCLEFYNNVIVI